MDKNSDYWSSLIEEKERLKIRINEIDNELKSRPEGPPLKVFLNEEQVKMVRDAFETGTSVSGIARIFNVHRSSVSRIVRLKTHKTI